MCEALALAPRELLSEDYQFLSSGSDTDEEGPSGAAEDVPMGSATSPSQPPPAAADLSAQPGAGRVAQQLAAARASTSGGMAVGEDAGRTALSAFLEHLVTKNSGATRSVQEVGLSGAALQGGRAAAAAPTHRCRLDPRNRAPLGAVSHCAEAWRLCADPTVLVTTYYALLHLLRPHLEGRDSGGAWKGFIDVSAIVFLLLVPFLLWMSLRAGHVLEGEGE